MSLSVPINRIGNGGADSKAVANHALAKETFLLIWQPALVPTGQAEISDPFWVKVTETCTYTEHEMIKFATAMCEPR